MIGPILFLYYINDIPRASHPQYADKTIAYLTVTLPSDCAKLQEDLHLLAIWEEKWKVSFHLDKCHVLSVTNKAKKIHYDYKLQGHTL